MNVQMKKTLSIAMLMMTFSVSVSAESLKQVADLKSAAPQVGLDGKAKCQVNESIQRNAIPKTPDNMSLPAFGQGVIGWATGEDGAKKRLENIQKSDLKAIREKGTTLAIVKEWQAFYENEVKRNPCNPTAPYRAELMKKIAWMWVE